MTEIGSTTTEAEQILPFPEKRKRTSRASAGASAATTKMALVSKLLARARGASIAELGSVTGWQLHSVRALLSGMRKKGVRLARETRKSGEGCYRIAVDDATPAPSPIAAAAATPAA